MEQVCRLADPCASLGHWRHARILVQRMASRRIDPICHLLCVLALVSSRTPALACVGSGDDRMRHPRLPYTPRRRHCQVGSLTGAVHLQNNNGGVQRSAQCGQKPHVEYKDKSWLDLDIQ